jgi:hypothetical protein
MQEGRFLIVLVRHHIIRQYWSELVTEGGGTHWVVLTGFSESWKEYADYSMYNWVRINNPFNNRREYYLWRDFIKSMANATSNENLNILLLWQDNPSFKWVH